MAPSDQLPEAILHDSSLAFRLSAWVHLRVILKFIIYLFKNNSWLFYGKERHLKMIMYTQISNKNHRGQERGGLFWMLQVFCICCWVQGQNLCQIPRSQIFCTLCLLQMEATKLLNGKGMERWKVNSQPENSHETVSPFRIYFSLPWISISLILHHSQVCIFWKWIETGVPHKQVYVCNMDKNFDQDL